MEEATPKRARPRVIAVPNVSEGRRADVIEKLTRSIGSGGARVLDIHSDGAHHRSVFTVAAPPRELSSAMVELARAARASIDLSAHDGVHPRLGALDVCPFVPVQDDIELAAEMARAAGSQMGDLGIPVYLYDAAATRPDLSELPAIRRAARPGVAQLLAEHPPDFGPTSADPRVGVVCVGARGPLIAFNVWLRSDRATAESIATSIRESSGGLPGVRALGLAIAVDKSQVSMNLTRPEETGIDEALANVRRLADKEQVEVEAAEIVGLVPEKFLPRESETARLLIQPGRSLDSALEL